MSLAELFKLSTEENTALKIVNDLEHLLQEGKNLEEAIQIIRKNYLGN